MFVDARGAILAHVEQACTAADAKERGSLDRAGQDRHGVTLKHASDGCLSGFIDPCQAGQGGVAPVQVPLRPSPSGAVEAVRAC